MLKLNAELVYLILQFCREEELNESLHVLERETAVFFDLDYFELLVLSGKWEEVERYLSGYGSLMDNEFLFEVYFEVRKHKLFEALHIGNHGKAVEIFENELEVFASHDEELFKEITSLLALDNFREHKLQRSFGDIQSARRSLSKKVRQIIEADPSFHGKLEFPTIEMARLRCLINQSLNWQHSRCNNPEQFPGIETLFEDHFCSPICQSTQSNLKPDYPVYSESSDLRTSKFNEDCDSQEEVWPCPIDFPVITACVLNEESNPATMDFHPIDNSILLVGTDDGDVSLWDIALRRKLLSRSFSVWCIGECTLKFKEDFTDNLHVSTKRTRWNSGGNLIGVAFSQHIVQIYTYEAGVGIFQNLEIDAHDGSVNDIAFSKPDKETFAITCGDDKLVKVWDATGASLYVFDGHKTAVTCACPSEIEGVNMVFSTSVIGEMRGWMYDSLKHRIAVNDPCCRRMVCSNNGKRILSCGLNEDEKYCILEWDLESSSVKNTYQGVQKPCPGLVHFDTANNQILAAGDNHQIEFWDMRNGELVSSTDTSKTFPVYPYIRFNKDGSLLAVSATENRIVILATACGLELLASCKECHSVVDVRDNAFLLEASRIGIAEDYNRTGALLLERHPQLHVRKLSNDMKGGKICRMAYTKAGDSVVALTSSGTHLVWRWSLSDMNSLDNDRSVPQMWKPKHGSSVMLNIPGPFPDIISCFALTTNDSYLISSSGGELSLYDMPTFKRLSTFISPLPQTTAIAIYPQDNNVIAIGRSDSTILIYSIPFGEVKCKLEGHSGLVTDLAFSTALDTLISSGVDSKICVWDTEKWFMKATTTWDRLTGARIQFHQDQVHFLVIDSTVLAIYDAQKLQCRNQWFVAENSSPITSAAFSCDGKMIYACFHDATVSMFELQTSN